MEVLRMVPVSKGEKTLGIVLLMARERDSGGLGSHFAGSPLGDLSRSFREGR
jgi:hypothetical protein